jgi:hypothetical protein
MGTIFRVTVVIVVMSAGLAEAQSLEDAQRLFYSGRFDAAAAQALHLRTANPGNLAASELRTSAILFQIKRALGDVAEKDTDRATAWQRCTTCASLMTEFLAELAHGQAKARAILAANPADEHALFFLGKLDLNYVWLHLGTLGKRAGWSEYWEARKSLDAVLKKNPSHIRARVARAWIDYIVATKVPRGARWLVGGGNRQRGLVTVEAAATAEADFFEQTEAQFALWDMQIRERNFTDALSTARALARDFPDNQDLTRFIARHGSR